MRLSSQYSIGEEGTQNLTLHQMKVEGVYLKHDNIKMFLHFIFSAEKN